MNKIFLLFFLLLAQTCFAADYVCYDEKGQIVEVKISVDGSSLYSCIKVTREQALSVTKYHKVEGNELVEMTNKEKDDLDAEELDKKNQQESKISSIKSKLISLGLTDEEASIIINN